MSQTPNADDRNLNEVKARADREFDRANAAEAEVARLAEELLLLGRALAESSNGTVIVDMRQEDRPIVYASEAFIRMSGYERHEIMGRNCRFMQRHDRDQEALDQIRDAVKYGREAIVTLRNYRKNGEMFWNELRLAPVKDEEGVVTHFVGIQNDVSAFKMSQEQLVRLNRVLEERVDRRTEELLELNRQMQSFTYSISHDLRAPLRAIISASMILMEDFGVSVSREMRDLLHQQVDASQRLGTLIDDLLKLSRLGRAQMEKSTINFSELCEKVAQDVIRRPGREGMRVSVQPEMTIIADATLMTIVMENLLDNAGKFVRPGEAAVVEIGLENHEGEDVIVVRDHGIGVDPEYVEKIFQPFERLHTEQQFPGSGIGLANVRLVVQRHGGRIWAEGKPGDGLAIRFTLGSDQLRLRSSRTS